MTEQPEQEQPPSPIEEERRAIDYIARTPEGKLFHRYLRRILEAVYDVQEDGALRVHTGRRTLARDLMRLMADGIEATRATNDGHGNDPILTRSGGPVSTGRARGSVRDYLAAEHARDPTSWPAADPEPTDRRSPGRSRSRRRS